MAEPWNSLRRVTLTGGASEPTDYTRYLWQALRLRNTGQLACRQCGKVLRQNARNLSPWLVSRIQGDHSRKEHNAHSN